MEALWNRGGGATVREIVMAVYSRHEHSLHAGVKSFLDRLIEKGYVKVDKTGFAHQFFPLVSRKVRRSAASAPGRKSFRRLAHSALAVAC